MKTLNYIFLAGCLLVFLFSCKKLIEISSPANQLSTDKVYGDINAATAAMENAYLAFDRSVNPNFTLYISLYADDLNYTGTNLNIQDFAKSRVSPLNGFNSNTWSSLYQVIYQCNDIIDGVQKSTGLPRESALAFTNEARFLRAYAYSYLLNVFGNVPLILSTDITQTNHSPQVDSTKVCNQIIADLNAAQNNLAEPYRGAGKVRANKWAALALLARVNLYAANWAGAEAAATSVIKSGLYGPLEDPSRVFLANSKETILQFWTKGGYTTDGGTLNPSSGVPQYLLTDNFRNSCEPGDLRFSNWVKSITVGSGASANTYYYPYKYHNRSTNSTSPEYLMALRLAEQFLIRAEARARQNNLSGAAEDINIIRSRAGLPNLTPNSQADLLTAIAKERRTELFTEWGHRFIDLKRTGRLDATLSGYKTSWVATAARLPIPQQEIAVDAGLIQNPGY